MPVTKSIFSGRTNFCPPLLFNAVRVSNSKADEDKAAFRDVDKYLQMWKLVASGETVCLRAARLGMPAHIRLILSYWDSLLLHVFALDCSIVLEHVLFMPSGLL